MPTHALNDTHLGSLAVYLQSRDASAQLHGASCLFYLNQVIMPPPDTSILVGLISAEVPYSFYNVNVNNNTMTVEQTENGQTTSKNVVLPLQNYDVDEMILTVNTILHAQPNAMPNVSLSFDEGANKFTLQHTGNSGTVKITDSTMKNLMGFTANQHDVAAQSITANNCVNLAGTSSVYVNLNNLGLANLDSRGDLNGVVSKLNVNCNPGEFIFYQQTETQYYLISNQQIQYFHLSLTDDDNNLLDMNGGDFSVTLSIHFSKKRSPFSRDQYLFSRRQPQSIEAPPEQAPEPVTANRKKTKNKKSKN